MYLRVEGRRGKHYFPVERESNLVALGQSTIKTNNLPYDKLVNRRSLEGLAKGTHLTTRDAAPASGNGKWFRLIRDSRTNDLIDLLIITHR